MSHAGGHIQQIIIIAIKFDTPSNRIIHQKEIIISLTKKLVKEIVQPKVEIYLF